MFPPKLSVGTYEEWMSDIEQMVGILYQQCSSKVVFQKFCTLRREFRDYNTLEQRQHEPIVS